MFDLKPVEEEKPKRLRNYDFFIEEVKARIKSKRNIVIVIHGPTGSGKSYLALRMAEVLDPTFNIERVVFTPEDFFRQVKHLPQGAFIVFDEAGVTLDARRFMEMINVVTNYVLESFRYRLINVIFTVPSIKMIDINVRRLMHVLIFQKDRGFARIYKINMGYDGSTWAYRVGTFVNVPMPSKLLREAYEKKKHDAFERLLDEAMERITEGKFGGENVIEEDEIDNVPVLKDEIEKVVEAKLNG